MYLNNREEQLNGKKTYPEWYAFGRSQSILYSDKNVFTYRFIDPKSIEQNTFIHQNIFTPQLFCIEPNTEADIDIIARVLIILILFHRIRLNAAGDG
jgi:hypothetical protein